MEHCGAPVTPRARYLLAAPPLVFLGVFYFYPLVMARDAVRVGVDLHEVDALADQHPPGLERFDVQATRIQSTGLTAVSQTGVARDA